MDPATTEIYTLSLHAALPILAELPSVEVRWAVRGEPARRGDQVAQPSGEGRGVGDVAGGPAAVAAAVQAQGRRSEEHTSELQSRQYLVCRLLLEKKNKALSVR